MPTPEDFRNELEEDAAEDLQHIEEVAPAPEMPEQVADMAGMLDTAEADVAPEAVREPEIADSDVPIPPEALGQPEPPVPVDATVARMGDMQHTAIAELPAESPPEIPALADMEQTAKADLPPERSQFEQVRQSIPRQQQEQLEFEAGRFDAGMIDSEQLTAETAYRETDYAWKRLMTHMVIDHQHRLEQLLAMLERER